MKKLLLLFVFNISLSVFTQELNKTKDGYSKIVDVELSKKEIYQKLNEWIGLNYVSAKDVIQLNTDEMIIVKGSIPINFEFHYGTFEIGVRHTLQISFRENKYKIDFLPTSAYQTNNGNELKDSKFLKQFIRTEPQKNDDEFLLTKKNAIKEELLKSGVGYNEKNATKAANRKATKNIQKLYRRYVINQRRWNVSIRMFYEKITDYVKVNKDEDW